MITIHGNDPVGPFTPAGLLQKAADEFKDIDFELFVEGGGQAGSPQWAMDNYRLNGQHNGDCSVLFYTQPGWGRIFEQQRGRYNIQCQTYACDPEFHKRHDVKEIYDVGFIGQPDGDDRANYLAAIKEAFPNSLISNGTPNEELPKALSECKVLFNHIKTEEINIRFFENMALGAQVVTHSPALHLYANEGEHYLSCKTPEEAVAQIKFLLENEDKRKKMIEDSRKHAVKNHTYKHRLLSMLRFVNKI